MRNSIAGNDLIANTQNKTGGFNQKTFTEDAEKHAGFSTEFRESDEFCCEGGGTGYPYYDLTPNELEDLLRDILKALDNFDQLFNKKKPHLKSLDRIQKRQYKYLHYLKSLVLSFWMFMLNTIAFIMVKSSNMNEKSPKHTHFGHMVV